MTRFFILSAFFLSTACTSIPELERSGCVTLGENCPTVTREQVTAVTCDCVCSTPLDAIYGRLRERIRTCLPEELNAPLGASEERRMELLAMSEPEYYGEIDAWCTANVTTQLQNIAEGLASMCGSINCDCTADTDSLEELAECETPCDTIHCSGAVCPKAILDKATGDVDIPACACTQSDYCGRESTGTICRPDIITDT